ncbi:hypothetical protein F2Q68_00010490 [Brassica cretica]|uniref:Uncharacterized protein n=1 Tax=Brassica cretica TaxID=69181 RepID=A0A8S9KRA4_BRACR|nr:hypothetical protein F2Q68_00010490 [Brassica cretica]
MIDGSDYQALVGTWPSGHVALGAHSSSGQESSVLEGTWPKQMVDLSVCCSENDASMCFSEHGGTLQMSWRSWPEQVRNLALAAVELVSSGHGPLSSFFRSRENPSCPSWYLIKGRFPFILRQDKSLGLEAGCRTQTWGGDPDPGAGTWKPEGGTRDLEEGTWMPEAGAGNNMIFLIGLREYHHGIKLLVEFGVGRRLVARVFKLPYRVCLDVLALGLKGFTAGLEMLDFSLHFMRLSGSMNRVEECMGQDLGVFLRGRILVRLRIRGMRRFNKTRRILMLDSAGLACAT